MAFLSFELLTVFQIQVSGKKLLTGAEVPLNSGDIEGKIVVFGQNIVKIKMLNGVDFNI